MDSSDSDRARAPSDPEPSDPEPSDPEPSDPEPSDPGSSGRKADRPAGELAASNDLDRLARVTEDTVGRHLLARGVLIGAALTVAMTLFIVQNTRDVGFHWLWFDFGARLWAALLVAFLCGAVVSPLLLVAWKRSRQNRKESLALTRKLRGRRRPGAAPRGGKP